MHTERRPRVCLRTSYFLKYAKNITSQSGEDGILEEIFRLLSLGDNSICVDVGSWDGIHLSNTHNLLNFKGWQGLLIEANKERSNASKDIYRNSPNVRIENSFIELVGSNSLLNILEKHNYIPDNFDFLSIDIDGADYHVWNSLEGKYSPKVVCIEFNPSIPNRVIYIQDKSTSVNKGSSLLALIELGKQLNYTILVTTLYNAIFVHNSLLHLIPPAALINNDIDLLHDSSMITDFFQTYDGELLIAGTKKLLWHKLAINPSKFQVLSKKDRVYPFAPPACSRQAQALLSIQAIFKLIQQKYIQILCVKSVSPTAAVGSHPLYSHLSDILDYCDSSHIMDEYHLIGIFHNILDRCTVLLLLLRRLELWQLHNEYDFSDEETKQNLSSSPDSFPHPQHHPVHHSSTPLLLLVKSHYQRMATVYRGKMESDISMRCCRHTVCINQLCVSDLISNHVVTKATTGVPETMDSLSIELLPYPSTHPPTSLTDVFGTHVELIETALNSTLFSGESFFEVALEAYCSLQYIDEVCRRADHK